MQQRQYGLQSLKYYPIWLLTENVYQPLVYKIVEWDHKRSGIRRREYYCPVKRDFLKNKNRMQPGRTRLQISLLGSLGRPPYSHHSHYYKILQIWALPILQISPRILFLIYCSDHILFIRNLQGFPMLTDILGPLSQGPEWSDCILIFWPYFPRLNLDRTRHPAWISGFCASAHTFYSTWNALLFFKLCAYSPLSFVKSLFCHVL